MRSQTKPSSSPSPPPCKNTKEEQHLSGAYIRSLVKQLSSSSTRPKDHTMTPPQPLAHETPQQQTQTQTQIPQPHKKQVRRRLHTSRPYQERLLNMAEARREIVTALKIHRATMRQAKEQQQQQLLLQQQEVQEQQSQARSLLGLGNNVAPSQICNQELGKLTSYPITYPFSNYLYNNSTVPHFTCTSSLAWPHTPIAPMATLHGLDLTLPAQPLGLNLSFQGFHGVDATTATSLCKNPPLVQQSPSSASSCSYSSPPTATEDTSRALHRVMGEEEMAEMYSIGEQHDIEWSDTMNLVTSAWWSKLLESMEGGGARGSDGGIGLGGRDHGDVGLDVLVSGDDVFDVPRWLCDGIGQQGKESSVLDQHLVDYYQAGGYSDDVSLPRLDIGEIEGWDAEWFS